MYYSIRTSQNWPDCKTNGQTVSTKTKCVLKHKNTGVWKHTGPENKIGLTREEGWGIIKNYPSSTREKKNKNVATQKQIQSP